MRTSKAKESDPNPTQPLDRNSLISYVDTQHKVYAIGKYWADALLESIR